MFTKIVKGMWLGILAVIGVLLVMFMIAVVASLFQMATGIETTSLVGTGLAYALIIGLFVLLPCWALVAIVRHFRRNRQIDNRDLTVR